MNTTQTLALADVPLSAIIGDPDNERGPLDETAPALQGLTESVKTRGLVEPIRLVPLGTGQYMIAFGHRRVAAARTAGLDTVPALIWTADRTEQDRTIDRLLTNMVREDLSGPQIAGALYTLLSNNPHLTQRELGAMLGISQAHVANLLRLRTLPADVQALLCAGTLSTGHAYHLLRIHEPELNITGRPTGREAAHVQSAFAADAVAGDLPVRALERRILAWLSQQAEYRAVAREREARHNAPSDAPRAGRPPLPFRPVLPEPAPVAARPARQAEGSKRERQQAEIVARRAVVAHSMIDQRLDYTPGAVPSLDMLRVVAYVTLQGAGVPRGEWIKRIEAAPNRDALLSVLADLTRAAITLNEQAHGLAAGSELNAWVDARWRLNRAIAEALHNADLLTDRSFVALTGEAAS